MYSRNHEAGITGFQLIIKAELLFRTLMESFVIVRLYRFSYLIKTQDLAFMSANLVMPQPHASRLFILVIPAAFVQTG